MFILFLQGKKSGGDGAGYWKKDGRTGDGDDDDDGGSGELGWGREEGREEGRKVEDRGADTLFTFRPCSTVCTARFIVSIAL